MKHNGWIDSDIKSYLNWGVSLCCAIAERTIKSAILRRYLTLSLKFWAFKFNRSHSHCSSSTAYRPSTPSLTPKCSTSKTFDSSSSRPGLGWVPKIWTFTYWINTSLKSVQLSDTLNTSLQEKPSSESPPCSLLYTRHSLSTTMSAWPTSLEYYYSNMQSPFRPQLSGCNNIITLNSSTYSVRKSPSSHWTSRRHLFYQNIRPLWLHISVAEIYGSSRQRRPGLRQCVFVSHVQPC